MFIELLKQGGPVLWIILAGGVVALVTFIERSLHLHRARIKAEDFLNGILNILGRKNIKEALAICDDTPGPVAYIVRIAILHREGSKDNIVTAVRDASAAETSRMERRLVILATVAQVAPLLGLLGTVLGMMESLLIMQGQAPFIQSVDLMDGLLRALTTTAAGLTVAIPCHVAFNLLVVKIDRIVVDMERAANEIVAFLGAAGREGAPDAGTGTEPGEA